MMSLREYRGRAANLADFLPWAALVAPGVRAGQAFGFECLDAAVTELLLLGIEQIPMWTADAVWRERLFQVA